MARLDAGRILVRLPNWVGDVVMATSTLRAVRSTWPEAEIIAEGRGFIAGLVGNLPTIDRFVPEAHARGHLSSILARRRSLREQATDLAILLPDSVHAAVGPFLARIPRRVGYARDLVRRALLTDALDPPREDGKRVPVPMPDRYLAIVRSLGGPEIAAPTELVVDPGAAASVAARLSGAGLGGDARLVVLSPGASFGSSKLYSPGSFARACDLLAERLDLVSVLAPGPGEEQLAADIADRMEARAVTLLDPVTSLAELVALTARSVLSFGNDTGPRHIAVALGVPAVTVMGPTDPRHTDYQLDRQRVLREDVDCSPCHLKTCPIDHRCMTRLAPERVVEAAEELLS